MMSIMEKVRAEGGPKVLFVLAARRESAVGPDDELFKAEPTIK
jgi:hypothetical protein